MCLRMFSPVHACRCTELCSENIELQKQVSDYSAQANTTSSAVQEAQDRLAELEVELKELGRENNDLRGVLEGLLQAHPSGAQVPDNEASSPAMPVLLKELLNARLAVQSLESVSAFSQLPARVQCFATGWILAARQRWLHGCRTSGRCNWTWLSALLGARVRLRSRQVRRFAGTAMPGKPRPAPRCRAVVSDVAGLQGPLQFKALVLAALPAGVTCHRHLRSDTRTFPS